MVLDEIRKIKFNRREEKRKLKEENYRKKQLQIIENKENLYKCALLFIDMLFMQCMRAIDFMKYKTTKKARIIIKIHDYIKVGNTQVKIHNLMYGFLKRQTIKYKNGYHLLENTDWKNRKPVTKVITELDDSPFRIVQKHMAKKGYYLLDLGENGIILYLDKPLFYDNVDTNQWHGLDRLE